MKSKLKHEIGSRMQQVRKEFGWTQEKMAAHFKVGRANFSRIEKGDIFPNPTMLYTLKSDFNISLEWLICGDGEMFITDRPEKIKGLPDFGVHTKEIHDLLFHMKCVPMVLHQVLGFFLNYEAKNRGLIQTFLQAQERKEA
jgi:transcriptional regulator with XRE-family HTH domain